MLKVNKKGGISAQILAGSLKEKEKTLNVTIV